MKRVVVVDDSPIVVKNISETLEKLGWDVVATGASSKDAISLCSNLQPNLLLLDVHLKDGSSVDAIKKIEKVAQMPIVMLTAFDKYIMDALKHESVMAYLLKPVDAKDLKPVLEFAVVRYKEHLALLKSNVALEEALQSRKVIDKAKGILMKKEDLSEEDAYNKIKKISMDRRKTMKEVSEIVIDL